MNWIALLFIVEAGFMPMNNWIDNQQMSVHEQSAYYVHMDAEVVAWEHLFIGGWAETTMHAKEGSYLFDPQSQTYEFRAGVRFDPVEIGIKHVCGPHPVHTYPDMEPIESRAPFEGAYEKVYIRFKGSY